MLLPSREGDGVILQREGKMVSEQGVKHRKGKIIAVVNNKGGVGKTCVACNLSHTLTRYKKELRVLVIDTDSQCSTTELLFADQMTQTSHSLYDVLNPETPNFPVEKAHFPTSFSNLYIIPNIPNTAGLEPLFLDGYPKSLRTLRNRVRGFCQENFDFTFIDCPPNVGTFVLMALYTADLVIVPHEAASTFSLEGLINAVKLIRRISIDENPDLRFLKLVINKLDRRTLAARATLQHCASLFAPEERFSTIIPVCAPFYGAERERQPILRFAPSSPRAKAFKLLAEEFDAIFSNV